MENMEAMTFRAGGLVAQQSSTTSMINTAMGTTGAQDTDRSTYTGEANWVPTWWFNPQGAIKASLGISAFKNGLTGSKFLVTDYQLLFAYDVLPMLALEGGGGGQTWFNNGGTHPMASGNVVYLLKDAFLDEIYAGYSRFFLPDNGANEYHLGIGVRL